MLNKAIEFIESYTNHKYSCGVYGGQKFDNPCHCNYEEEKKQAIVLLQSAQTEHSALTAKIEKIKELMDNASGLFIDNMEIRKILAEKG